jgi:hypothetical protein
MPKLEAVTRENAEDIMKYLAYRKQMIIYMRRQGMLEYVEGTVKPPKIPKGKKPSKKKLEDALRALSIDRSAALKEKYVKLVKLERSYQAYEEYMHIRNSTMAVLGLSLNNDATIEFIKDEDDNDIQDPALLLKNMDNYFLENSEIVIQNLRSDVNNLKLKKNFSVDDVGNEMKKIYRYLKALGRPEDEESKKFNLSSTIMNFKYSTAEQKQCVLNVVGRGDAYSIMNFDGMIQALKSLERIFKTDMNIVSPNINKVEKNENDNVNDQSNDTMAFYASVRKRGCINSNGSRDSGSKKKKVERDSVVKNFKFSGKCFCCGGYGHKSENCPSEECDNEKSSDKRPRDKTYTMFDQDSDSENEASY